MSSTVGKSTEEDIAGVGKGRCGLARETATMAIKEGSVEHSARLAKEEAETRVGGVACKSLFQVNSITGQTEQPCIQTCSFPQSSANTSSFMVKMGMLRPAEKSTSTPAVGPSPHQDSSVINSSLLEAIHKVINSDSAVATSTTDITFKGQSIGMHKVVPVRSTPVLLRMLPLNNKVVVKRNGCTVIDPSFSKEITVTDKITCRPVVLNKNQLLQRKPLAINGNLASLATGDLFRESELAKENDNVLEVHTTKDKIAAEYERSADNETSRWSTPLLQRNDLNCDTMVTNKSLSATSNRMWPGNEKDEMSYCRPTYSGAAERKPSYCFQKDVPLLQREDLAIGGISVPKSVVGSCARTAVKETNISLSGQQSLFDTSTKCNSTIRQPLPIQDVPLLQRTDLAVDGVSPHKPVINMYSKNKRLNSEVTDHAINDDTTLLQSKDQTVNNGVPACQPMTDVNNKLMAAGKKNVNVSNNLSKEGVTANNSTAVLPQLASLVLQKKYQTFNAIFSDKPAIATYSRKMGAKVKVGCGHNTPGFPTGVDPTCSQVMEVRNAVHQGSSCTLASQKPKSLTQASNKVSDGGCVSQPVVNLDEPKAACKANNSIGYANVMEPVAAYKNSQTPAQSSSILMTKDGPCVSSVVIPQMVVTKVNEGEVRQEESKIPLAHTVAKEASTVYKHCQQSVFSKKVCVSVENSDVVMDSRKQLLSAACGGMNVIKEKNAPPVNCPSMEDATIPRKNSISSISHVNVQFQKDVHPLEGAMTQQVGITDNHGKDLVVGKLVLFPEVMENGLIVNQAQCNSSSPINFGNFQEGQGTENELAVEEVTLSGNCNEMQDKDGEVINSAVKVAVPMQGVICGSVSAMDTLPSPEKDLVSSKHVPKQKSATVDSRQEVKIGADLNVADITAVGSTLTARKDVNMEKNNRYCSFFQPSATKNKAELLAMGQDSSTGNDSSNTHEINKHYSVPLANIELWRVKEEIVDNSLTCTSLQVMDNEEEQIIEGPDSCNNVHDEQDSSNTHIANEHCSSPLANTMLCQEKDGMVEDDSISKISSSPGGDKSGVIKEELYCIDVSVEKGSEIISQSTVCQSACPVDHTVLNVRDQAVDHLKAVQSAGSMDNVMTVTGRYATSEGAALRCTVPDRRAARCSVPDSVVLRGPAPVRAAVRCPAPVRAALRCPAPVRAALRCPASDSAAVRYPAPDTAARMATVPACKIVISVRPNLPATMRQSRQYYPMSLERQFDVAISPSTCSDDATKVHNQATLSTPEEVKEFPKECHASAASIEILDFQVLERRKVRSTEYLPGVSSPSVSDHPQKAAGGANVSEGAASVCHKRSKPVVNLSSLTKRQPLEVNRSSSIVCRPSSAAPNCSSTSQRVIGGIYADVIRDTSVTEALGRQGGSRRKWNRWPRSSVCRLDEPSPSKFQTFSQFRAEQLSSQMRTRQLNRAKSFTASFDSDQETAGNTVEPDWSETWTAQPRMWNGEQPTADCKMMKRLPTDSKEDVKEQWDDMQLKKARTKQRRGFDHMAWSQDSRSQTMEDLIYSNPPSNPMRKTTSVAVEPMIFMDDECYMSPDESTEDAMPVPQVVLNDDGQVVIDEKSLFVDVEEVAKRRARRGRKRKAEDNLAEAIRDDQTPHRRSRKWKHNETLKFYRALNAVGTDFSVMETFFLDRTRKELKQKFLREDKANRELIDRTLQNPGIFTTDDLEQELEEDKLEKKKQEEELLEKERLKKERKERRLSEKQQKLREKRNDMLLHNKIIYKSKRHYQKTRRKVQQPARKLQPVRKAALKQRRAGTPGAKRRRRRRSNTKRKEPQADLEQLEAGADLCKLLEESISSELAGKLDGQSAPPHEATTPGSLLVLSAPSPTGRIYKVFMVNAGPHSKPPPTS